MAILSYLHQLFDVQSCYAYIHRLRCKDRLLQCPRCQSQDIEELVEVRENRHG